MRWPLKRTKQYNFVETSQTSFAIIGLKKTKAASLIGKKKFTMVSFSQVFNCEMFGWFKAILAITSALSLYGVYKSHKCLNH